MPKQKKRKKPSDKKTFFAKSYYDYLRASQEARRITAAWVGIETKNKKGKLVSGSQKLLEARNDEELIFNLGESIAILLDSRRLQHQETIVKALDPITSILDAIYTSVDRAGGELLQGWHTRRPNGDTSLLTQGKQCLASEMVQTSAIYEAIRNCVKFNIDAKNPTTGVSYRTNEGVSFTWHTNRKLHQDIENERFLKQSICARLPFPAIFVDHPAAAFLAIEINLDKSNLSLESQDPTHIIVFPIDKTSDEETIVVPVRLLIPIDTEVTIGKTAYQFRPAKDHPDYEKLLIPAGPMIEQIKSGPRNEDQIVLHVPGIEADTNYESFYEEFFMHTFNSGAFKTSSFPLEMCRSLVELYARGAKNEKAHDAFAISFSCLQSATLETYNLFWTFLRMQQLQGDRINKKTFGIIKPKMMANKKLKKKERPLVEFHTLQIELEREINVSDFPTHIIRGKNKWHKVKSHMREYKEPLKSGPNKGKTRIFIKSCGRGDADKGIIISDYNLTEDHKPEEIEPDE